MLVFTDNDAYTLLEEWDCYEMTRYLFFAFSEMPERQVDMYLPKLYKLLLFHQHNCSS